MKYIQLALFKLRTAVFIYGITYYILIREMCKYIECLSFGSYYCFDIDWCTINRYRHQCVRKLITMQIAPMKRPNNYNVCLSIGYYVSMSNQVKLCIYLVHVHSPQKTNIFNASTQIFCRELICNIGIPKAYMPLSIHGHFRTRSIRFIYCTISFWISIIDSTDRK